MDMAALPLLDKDLMIGAGCARLPLQVDAAAIQAEVGALPDGLWGNPGGRGGVHDRAEAIWLRGHAPVEQRPTIEEREVFAKLPQLRRLVMKTIAAPPMRCLLARLPAGCHVPAHADTGQYFLRTLRLHVPVISSAHVKMYADGRVYHMEPGEVWVLNNAAVHGVLNDDPVQPRTHLIADFLPSHHLLAMLDAAEIDLGIAMTDVDARFASLFDERAPKPVGHS